MLVVKMDGAALVVGLASNFPEDSRGMSVRNNYCKSTDSQDKIWCSLTSLHIFSFLCEDFFPVQNPGEG